MSKFTLLQLANELNLAYPMRLQSADNVFFAPHSEDEFNANPALLPPTTFFHSPNKHLLDVIFLNTPWQWDRYQENNVFYLQQSAEDFFKYRNIPADTCVNTVRIYVMDPDPILFSNILINLDHCLKLVGVEVEPVGPPVQGSWYQVAIAIYKITTKPFVKLKSFLEHSLMIESKNISSRTKDTIALLEALKKIKKATIQVGPILIIKTQNNDGDNIVIKDLSYESQSILGNNTILLQHPEKLNDALKKDEEN